MRDHGQITDPAPTRCENIADVLDRLAEQDRQRQQREQSERDHAERMMARYLANAQRRHARGDIKGAAMNVRAAARYAERIH